MIGLARPVHESSDQLALKSALSNAVSSTHPNLAPPAKLFANMVLIFVPRVLNLNAQVFD